MAVLLLMLPAADLARPASGAATGAPRTYKLSLSANADLATIEVDGRAPTTTPVQRVYPTPPARPVSSGLAVLRQAPINPSPPRARYAPPPPAAFDAPLPLSDSAAFPEPPRAHQMRRPASVVSTRGAPPAFEPIVFASPNGAPIIE